MIWTLRNGKQFQGRTVEPIFPVCSYEYAELVRHALAENPSIPTTSEDLAPQGSPSPASPNDPPPRKRKRSRSPTAETSPPKPDPVSSSPTHLASTSSHPSALAPPSAKSSQSYRNHRRARDRKLQKERPDYVPVLRKKTKQKYTAPANPILTEKPAELLDYAHGAFLGKMGNARWHEVGGPLGAKTVYHLGVLTTRFRLRHIVWDGFTPTPILDSRGRIVAILLGRPDDPRWFLLMDEAFEMMESEREAAGIKTKSADHRRGRFPAFNRGIVMGMGSRRPVALDNEGWGPMLDRLVGAECFIAMASYQSGFAAAFAAWAPRLHDRYRTTINAVYAAHPELPRNFQRSVFAAIALNFGANVWTFRHRDFMNYAFGWCVITALGRFDHTKGGQLILWELGLVVDFPAGSSIAIPSAVCTHSNIPVQEGEKRNSVTQYTAGAIFRWVDNGCQTEEELQCNDPVRYERMMQEKDTKFEDHISLFSSLDELVAPVSAE